MRGASMAIGMTLLGGGCLAIGIGIGREFRPTASSEPPTQSFEETAAPVASVQVQALKRGSLTETVNAYGTVQSAPGTAANLSEPFDTKVQGVLVAVGNHVDVGTPVIELSPTPEVLLQLQQAQDALTAANANLNHAQRRRDQQLATNTDVAAAEQARRAAQTQVQSLEQRGVGKSTTVTATIAGVVTQLNVQTGQLAASGTALAVISPQTDLLAFVGVDSAAADVLQLNAEATVFDAQDPNHTTAIGHIASIMQQIDPQTHLRNTAIALPRESHLLQGTFVVASLSTRHGEGWVVPRSAVLPDDDAQVLFTVVDGKAKRHEVRIVLSNNEAILISSDQLHEDDSIVVGGNAELEDGMAIAAAPTTAPASSPASEEK